MYHPFFPVLSFVFFYISLFARYFLSFNIVQYSIVFYLSNDLISYQPIVYRNRNRTMLRRLNSNKTNSSIRTESAQNKCVSSQTLNEIDDLISVLDSFSISDPIKDNSTDPSTCDNFYTKYKHAIQTVLNPFPKNKVEVSTQAGICRTHGLNIAFCIIMHN